MRIEVLWWEGCPSTTSAVEQLRAALAEVGLDPDAVELREVTSDEEAVRERFAGSPTIRVDDDDLFPTGADDPVGLSCRLYRRRDGRPSPTPDPDDLREALTRRMTA